MPRSVNFDNGGEQFNIDLDTQGNLNFNANSIDGGGNRRLRIDDDSGQLTIGGGGAFGAIQLQSNTDANVIFIGGTATEATALLGGGNSGQNGIVRLGNAAGLTTVDMAGSGGNVVLGANPAGGTPGQDGDLALRDGSGGTRIRLSGVDGKITCTDLTETSDARLKQSITPILNALDKVTALRGVCYEWKREDRSELGRNEGSQVGLIGQEVEAVCPELVATDSEGYKSLNYSRLTAVLVEAVKEQQQLIHMQASALAEAMRRIVHVEHALDAQ
jgi:Chaperone of endosialidase